MGLTVLMFQVGAQFLPYKNLPKTPRYISLGFDAWNATTHTLAVPLRTKLCKSHLICLGWLSQSPTTVTEVGHQPNTDNCSSEVN